MQAAKPFIVKAGNTVVGSVVLADWDEGMAVANGLFRPTPQYNAQTHATEIGGVLQGATCLSLTWADGSPLHCEAVSLVDWSSEAGEDGREITAFGVVDKAFPNGS